MDRDSIEGLTPDRLELENSAHVVLAVDGPSGRVVGLVLAVSDGGLAAYIPLLEVLPEYRGRGIGTELVRPMLDRLGHFYVVHLVCDRALAPFYSGSACGRTPG